MLGSTACAASSTTSASIGRAMRAKTPLPAKLSVEQMMSASSSISVWMRSRSAFSALGSASWILNIYVFVVSSDVC